MKGKGILHTTKILKNKVVGEYATKNNKKGIREVNMIQKVKQDE